MAEGFSEVQFKCSVCLDLLKNPVTLHCGHSYCMICITDCWNQEDPRGIYSCPQCRQTFSPRPVLGKNVVFAEIVEKLKRSKRSDVCYGESGDVECNVCTGRKYKAIKSCLTCLNSYCQSHLEQHENLFRVKRHDLMDSSGQLQEMICSKHEKEIYGCTDHRCICMLCMPDEHRNHDTVLTAAARKEKQSQLGETQSKVQQKIQQREKDLQKLKDSMESRKHCAQTAVEDCEAMFTELITFIERRRSDVTQLIRDQETAEVSQAEELMERLKHEIDDLKRTDSELHKLLPTGHHITFPQSFQSLSAPPETIEDNGVEFHFSFDSVRESVRQLRDKLQDFCTLHMRKISVTHTITDPRTRDDFLQYSHQLPMDLNTVNEYLHLSERNRDITNTWPQKYQHPDHPERFDYLYQVLCRESVCGRCYWEIEWNGSVVCISVSYKSIRRKGWGNECEFGGNDQSWSLICCDSSYSFKHNNTNTDLHVKPISHRIGVYVDERAGILSFYSVSDTMTLIHSINTTFTKPLYPGFIVYYNSSVKLCDLSI